MSSYDVSFHPILRGAFVPPDFTGVLRSRHSGVINFEMSDESGSYFVSLITDGNDWTAFSIRVDPEDLRRVARIPEGATVRCTCRSPHNVSPVPPVPERPPRELTDAIHPAIAALTQTDRITGLMPLVVAEGPGTGEDPFLRRARAVVAKAVNGFPPYDLSPLVGLGIGFTPSGDDFLGGVLLLQQIARVALVQTAPIGTALGKTTTGGATVLRLALAGALPDYLSRVADALLRGDPTAALSVARAHGHSSGLDALAGLLWGITAAGTII
ncbi:MAG: DUF2877 domain-containing protein [Alkalispirochaeta sp.]